MRIPPRTPSVQWQRSCIIKQELSKPQSDSQSGWNVYQSQSIESKPKPPMGNSASFWNSTASNLSESKMIIIIIIIIINQTSCSHSQLILGAQYQYLPKVLSIFALILNTRLVDAKLTQRILTIMQGQTDPSISCFTVFNHKLFFVFRNAS